MLHFILLWIVVVPGLGKPSQDANPGVEAHSPDGATTLVFSTPDGVPTYQLNRKGRPVIQRSKMGFRLRQGPALDCDFKISGSSITDTDETWEQPWGEVRRVRDRHREIKIDLEQTTGEHHRLQIIFRLFDDGLGIRYVIPRQPGLDSVLIDDEMTEFAMTADHRAWWIPAYQPNRYEYHYTEGRLGAIEKAHTPLTLRTKEGLYLSIHEAALTDFASMTLHRRTENTFKADLVPWSDGVRVRGPTPLVSPWRTIQISDSPGGLIESNLILNLNEPCKLADVSWIKPSKYIGIWWEMHLGKSTWHSGPKHGATTENTKRYIDFAAKHGFGGVLVEGWNRGWDGNWLENGDNFNFTEPYPDYDLPALAAYAKKKGVTLIGHHETAGGVENYDRQLEDAFALCQKLGIQVVKTGYVAYGRSIVRTDKDGKKHKEMHHGQYMVRHYQKVVETAARHHVMLDVHEPIKDTGLRRTYPNLMTSEGACGQEFDAWGGDDNNPPNHTTILPFTRLLAGPMDFTPGIFDLMYEEYRPNDRVSTTLAKQLALYVVIYSPLQMAADLPENYEARPEPFKFIQDVPADWDTTKVIDAEIGDYVTIARKARGSDEWFVGSITNENKRSLRLPMSFLDSARDYVAEVYRDDENSEWRTNPYPVVVESRRVNSQSSLSIQLAPGGGVAIRIRPE